MRPQFDKRTATLGTFVTKVKHLTIAVLIGSRCYHFLQPSENNAAAKT